MVRIFSFNLTMIDRMEGVILYADDAVFEDSFERKLFDKLTHSSSYPVLPINNLISFEKTIKSISTFRAILLDWEFIEKVEEEDTVLKKTPFDILRDNEFYSLIFVYSQSVIGDATKEALKAKFGDKIDFLIKVKDDDELTAESEKICSAISEFEKSNAHLEVPFLWSQTINKSIQKIFLNLEKADRFWIKDLYYSSYNLDKEGKPIEPPSIDANIQVINLFLNILSEHLIQDSKLRDSIKQYSESNLDSTTDSKELKKLYQFLYYTKLCETDAIMTGDVYELEEGKFGIVISPECDINVLINKDKKVELLCFGKSDFTDNFHNTFALKKSDGEKTKRAYNQENPRGHLLPTFPTNLSISDETTTAFIDFRFSMEHFSGKFLSDNISKRTVKINSPYIQQLRQRYLAYVGRIGVPTIPDSLRTLL